MDFRWVDSAALPHSKQQVWVLLGTVLDESFWVGCKVSRKCVALNYTPLTLAWHCFPNLHGSSPVYLHPVCLRVHFRAAHPFLFVHVRFAGV